MRNAHWGWTRDIVEGVGVDLPWYISELLLEFRNRYRTTVPQLYYDCNSGYPGYVIYQCSFFIRL